MYFTTFLVSRTRNHFYINNLCVFVSFHAIFCRCVFFLFIIICWGQKPETIVLHCCITWWEVKKLRTMSGRRQTSWISGLGLQAGLALCLGLGLTLCNILQTHRRTWANMGSAEYMLDAGRSIFCHCAMHCYLHSCQHFELRSICVWVNSLKIPWQQKNIKNIVYCSMKMRWWWEAKNVNSFIYWKHIYCCCERICCLHNGIVFYDAYFACLNRMQR